MSNDKVICTCGCGCEKDCAPIRIPLCYACGISAECERLSKDRGYAKRGGK